MKKKVRTLKKIFVRGLAWLGGVNLFFTFISVIAVIVIFLAVMMGKNPTHSPIEAFVYRYLKLAYASYWIVTVVTVVSMAWALLWVWNEKNKSPKKK